MPNNYKKLGEIDLLKIFFANSLCPKFICKIIFLGVSERCQEVSRKVILQIELKQMPFTKSAFLNGLVCQVTHLLLYSLVASVVFSLSFCLCSFIDSVI